MMTWSFRVQSFRNYSTNMLLILIISHKKRKIPYAFLGDQKSKLMINLHCKTEENFWEIVVNASVITQ